MKMNSVKDKIKYETKNKINPRIWAKINIKARYQIHGQVNSKINQKVRFCNIVDDQVIDYFYKT